MALYEELTRIDPLTPILGELKSSRFALKDDDVLQQTGEMVQGIDGPWINIKIATDRNCALWYRIYFGAYDIISRNCFHCFKIVCRPRNLDELFTLHELQVAQNVPCKAGIERRPWATHKGSYAGFWYCPMEGGLEGARDYHKQIKAEVQESLPEVDVILKRACTEMENAAGPSDEWVYPKEQHMMEDILDAMWDIDTDHGVECSSLRTMKRRIWIDYARERGDPTAEKYYDKYEHVGIAPTVLYDNEKEFELDLPGRGHRKEKRFAEFKQRGTTEKDSLQQVPENE